MQKTYTKRLGNDREPTRDRPPQRDREPVRDRGPAPERGPDRGRGRPPQRPSERAENERAPLGRELIDDADIFDDEDEIPSYMPRKAVPKPAAAPAVEKPTPVAEKPIVVVEKPAEVPPPPKRRTTSPAKSGTRPVRDLDAPKPPKVEKPPAVEAKVEKPVERKPAPMKPAAPEDTGGFGAGLDD